MANIRKSVKSQASRMPATMDRAVNRVSQGPRQRANASKWTDATEKQMEKECSHCGSHNHDGSSCKCPAMGRQCDKCRSQDQADAKRHPHRRGRWNQDGHSRKNRRVNALAAESDGNEGEGYVFRVNITDRVSTTLPFTVGGVSLRMLPDNGADDSFICASIWNRMRRKGMKWEPAGTAQGLPLHR